MDKAAVSRSNPLPLYHQVLEVLREDLEAGKFMPGAMFPSESELINRFGVSRATVRKALDELELAGLITRIQGQGTFVRARRIEQELTALTGFVEDMLQMNYRPSAKVITIEQVVADEKIAVNLGLPKGTPVTYIERVRLANEEPISFDITWLPNPLGEQIARENLAVFPIYSLLEGKYNVHLDHATYRIESTLARHLVAQHLKVNVGSPILAIERAAYCTDGKPVDYEILHYRGDRIRLTMNLNRKRPPWRLEDLENVQLGGVG